MVSLFRRSKRVIVEALQIDAADACARIHGEAFAHPWGADDFASMIASAGFICDGAAGDADGHDVLGFIVSRQVVDEAEVLSIAVADAHRRRGVAAMLLTQHLDRLRLARVRRLFLEVSAENAAARALYARFGFLEIGQRAGYYRLRDGSRATALVLSRQLI